VPYIQRCDDFGQNSMAYVFTVSPDFGPEHLCGWFIFNTWLQRVLGKSIHLEIYPSFLSQRKAIQDDQVDLIYANPFDASMLVRNKGFIPLVTPEGKSDEAVVVVNAGASIYSIEDLKPGIRIASTDDPDVHMMGMLMLEPAELDESNVFCDKCDTYILVAKRLLQNQSDVGIFLAEAFDDLSQIVKKQLKILVYGQIQVVRHALMIGPRMAHHAQQVADILVRMHSNDKGTSVLKGLGLERWKRMDREEMEFMIDLIDTLLV